MAVIANNVYFSHEREVLKDYTLNGVKLNVTVGSIYGLLGPSGCGKTTLLKCIIGLLRPSFGEILLFGYKPGDKRSGVPGGGIGYMPQEYGIQYDLTIEEILTYFGKLNLMKEEDIIDEIDFLVKILDLWDKHRLIGELSGGQKRRVSLAIAMLHKPRLLILDEPTVGVDPILNEVIWKLLADLSSSLKTTIIITTHYIDETKKANCVAFMRKGHILEENNPETLLRKYEAGCLDDVFLKLCVDQKQYKKASECSSVTYKQTVETQNKGVSVPYKSSTASEVKIFFCVLYAIVWKHMIETRRNPGSAILLILTTLSIVFAVKMAVGQTPRDLRVAWVVDKPENYNTYHSYNSIAVNYSKISNNLNNEYLNGKNDSGLFIGRNAYNETDEKITRVTEYEEEYEELYLPNILKKSIEGNIVKLVDYSNFSDAMRDAKRRIVHGIIHLKRNFSRSYLDCDPLFTEVDQYVDNETIDSGSIHVHLDVVNLVVGETINAVIVSALRPFREYIGEYFSLDEKLFSSPIIIQPINWEEDHHVTSIDDIFSVATFITPGVVAFNSFASCIGLCILSLLTPSECDMSVRNYAAGVRPVQTILGQVIARFIFMFFNSILNFLAITYILNVPCRGSVILIMILMWLQMLLGLNIGVLMSSSMTNSFISLYMAIAITMTLFSTNGAIWSIEYQPYYMKWLMRYSPLYYSCNTLRAMLFYSNATFQLIWPGFAFTILWTLLAFIATIYVLKGKK